MVIATAIAMTGRSAAIRAATATASTIATTAAIVASAISKAKAGKAKAARQRRERQQEPVAPVAEGGNDPRRRDRFQQPHEQPEFLRRPVRRARSESDEAEKDETSRD